MVAYYLPLIRFYKVAIDCSAYDSLYDYVNQLIIKGVDELFRRGFTFNGVRILHG